LFISGIGDAEWKLLRSVCVEMRTLPDRVLVQRARHGSRSAAGELFERHWPGAWRAAFAVTGRRDVAEDVAQDGFERAFAALDRFDPHRPFGPWLHRIVVNRALDVLRKDRRLVAMDEVPEHAVWDAEGDGDHAMLAAVATLSPDRRAVCVLRFGLGYAPGEIAELLEVPVGTVHSRLARALDDLRRTARATDVV
jgi:RNA polymerase sigma-70 factor (ECF subfamily)